MTAQTVTRKTAVRGSRVRVTFRNGPDMSGQLVGWGAQILELQLDAQSKQILGCNWKRNSFPTVFVTQVQAL